MNGPSSKFVHQEVEAIVKGEPTAETWLRIAQALPKVESSENTSRDVILQSYAVIAAIRGQFNRIPESIFNEITVRSSHNILRQELTGDTVDMLIQCRRNKLPYRCPLPHPTSSYYKFLQPSSRPEHHAKRAIMYGLTCTLTHEELFQSTVGGDEDHHGSFLIVAAALVGMEATVYTVDVPRLVPEYQHLREAYDRRLKTGKPLPRMEELLTHLAQLHIQYKLSTRKRKQMIKFSS